MLYTRPWMTIQAFSAELCWLTSATSVRVRVRVGVDSKVEGEGGDQGERVQNANAHPTPSISPRLHLDQLPPLRQRDRHPD